MHRDNIALRDLAGRSRKLCSKQFVTELHDQGYTPDGAIEAVCQVFGVPRRAARLFVVTHRRGRPRPLLKNRMADILHALRPRSRTASSSMGGAAKSATRGPFRSGWIPPRSDQYREIGPRGGRGREVTVVKGEPLPPTASNRTYKLVDPTKNQSSRGE